MKPFSLQHPTRVRPNSIENAISKVHGARFSERRYCGYCDHTAANPNTNYFRLYAFPDSIFPIITVTPSETSNNIINIIPANPT
jgi:hypothetical protein